jgi:branched-chain amino acid transport system substrate-binding protein
LLVAIPVATACSLLVSTDADQCSTTDDCQSRGAAFAGSVCSDDHVCIPGCSSNASCPSSTAGAHWICRHADHQCAQLESQDCQTLLADPGDIANDATIWLATLAPTIGTNAALGQPIQDGVEVARIELRRTLDGLPPASAGGPRRPVAFVACNDGADPTIAERAATHLVHDVKVPAIIGPAFSGVLTRVGLDITIGAGVLIMSASATSPAITKIQSTPPRLVWRTCPSDSEQAVAMSLLIQNKVEPDLRNPTTGILKAGDQLKLAVVNKGDNYGQGLANALFDALQFNGISAGKNQAAGNYKAFDYGDPDTDPAGASARYANAVKQLNDFAPHVVISVGTNEMIANIYTALETAWTTAAYKPRWVLSDGGEDPDVVKAIASNGDLRHRTLGTVPGAAPSSKNYVAFVSRYSSKITDGTTPNQYTPNGYDAAYLLSYAIVAVGDAPLTGSAVNTGLRKMVPTMPPAAAAMAIAAGPDAIPDAFTQLLAGNNIDYDGASGPLDFNIDTGEAPADIQVWCVSADTSGVANATVLSGQYYSAASQTLQGTLSCP